MWALGFAGSRLLVGRELEFLCREDKPLRGENICPHLPEGETESQKLWSLSNLWQRLRKEPGLEDPTLTASPRGLGGMPDWRGRTEHPV